MAVEDIAELEGIRFTPVEYRMINLLSDGEPHHRNELRKCLYDDLGRDLNIRVMICKIRSKIRPTGLIITTTFPNHIPCYVLSRGINSNLPQLNNP